ncbi:MAG: glycosyltransferase family 2 protein [Thermoanaerobaculia bacterium]
MVEPCGACEAVGLLHLLKMLQNGRVPAPPVLSIVIPTCNTAEMTLACCRAVLAATPPSCEVIVVDDASSDGTSELLRGAVPEVSVVRLETNRRYSGAVNAGVAASRGELVLLLNSDTLVDAGALTAMIDSFSREERLGVAGARLLNTDGTPQWSGGSKPTLLWLAVMVSGAARIVPRGGTPGGSDSVEWVSGTAMAFRRALWTVAGPMNETYCFYAQDLEFCVRARDAGWKVRIVEEARVIHHGGATIARERESVALSHDPALLWLDLLAWGRGHYGGLWAAMAWAGMCAGASVRIIARRLRELSLRGPRLSRERPVTDAYVRALAELVSSRD